MSTATKAAMIDIDTPYNYVPDEQKPVLRQLFRAVPEAKVLFEKGEVPAALRLIEEAKRVQLNPSVVDAHGHRVTKHAFLVLMAIDMPYKYSA